MARRHKHEEHANHEAWAIPYGDLVTLLLAFFVVMYAMSSVNEGKYRVLSDSMVAAFQGAPKTMQPIQVGAKQAGSGADVVQPTVLEGAPRGTLAPMSMGRGAAVLDDSEQPVEHTYDARTLQSREALAQLDAVANEVERGMADLIKDNLIVVRRHGLWVEVAIRTDILFASGMATLEPPAVAVLRQLAATLKPFPNPIRVEGHTDNRPISTRAFPSNWELSSARAAGVVHLFTEAGMDPARLAVIGLAEFRPAQSNATAEGRNANRRVLLAIMSGIDAPEGEYAQDRGKAEGPAPAPPVMVPVVETGTPVGVVVP
jgi:chemotaxis protein MotB